MQPTHADPPFLRAADVAQLLGLTPARVYQMVAAGELPYVRVGRRIRISTTSRTITFASRTQGWRSYSLVLRRLMVESALVQRPFSAHSSSSTCYASFPVGS